ncbi:hypothetical protein K435DRAFT_36478, partial [Dendrothele bispora CBS 962.96]
AGVTWSGAGVSQSRSQGSTTPPAQFCACSHPRMSSNIHPHHSDLVETHSHTETHPAFIVGESEGYTLSQFASQVDGYLTSPVKLFYPEVQDINLSQGQPELFDMEKLYHTQDMTTPAQSLSIEIPQMSPLTKNINMNMNSQTSQTIATYRVVNHAHSRRKNTPKYFCEVPECGRSFTTPHNYRNHMNMHRGIKPHGCGLCTYKSGTRHTLLRHVRAKHPEALGSYYMHRNDGQKFHCHIR